jgi:hypothetical protein
MSDGKEGREHKIGNATHFVVRIHGGGKAIKREGK